MEVIRPRLMDQFDRRFPVPRVWTAPVKQCWGSDLYNAAHWDCLHLSYAIGEEVPLVCTLVNALSLDFSPDHDRPVCPRREVSGALIRLIV